MIVAATGIFNGPSPFRLPRVKPAPVKKIATQSDSRVSVVL